jgi:hypothetical protein
MDPITAAGTAAVAADKLVSWYDRAQEAAQTQDAKDAAAVIYFAAVIATAVAALDDRFRALKDEIQELDLSARQENREKLAGELKGLRLSETRLREINRASGFLEDRLQRESGWRDRILHRSQRDPDLERTIGDLVGIANQVLQVIGAREKAPTPPGIGELEQAILEANDESAVGRAKDMADQVLGVIDSLTVRGVEQAFGRLASVLSNKHGISAPDWATVR